MCAWRLGPPSSPLGPYVRISLGSYIHRRLPRGYVGSLGSLPRTRFAAGSLVPSLSPPWPSPTPSPSQDPPPPSLSPAAMPTLASGAPCTDQTIRDSSMGPWDTKIGQFSFMYALAIFRFRRSGILGPATASGSLSPSWKQPSSRSFVHSACACALVRPVRQPAVLLRAWLQPTAGDSPIRWSSARPAKVRSAGGPGAVNERRSDGLQTVQRLQPPAGVWYL